MNKKQGKHHPEEQSAGNNPYKRFTTLLFDFLFFFDSHIRFPLRKVCERTLQGGPRGAEELLQPLGRAIKEKLAKLPIHDTLPKHLKMKLQNLKFSFVGNRKMIRGLKMRMK
jgi:hypothetical protein